MFVKIKGNLRGLNVIMDRKSHYFYAVKIPEETKEQLHKEIMKYQPSLPFGRWVHPADYHITLAFLGFAEDKELKESIDTIPKMLENKNPFSLEINGLGVFGDRKAPRIFWAKLREEKQLSSVRENVYDACQNAGFLLEKRPFHPHITLARKWKGIEEFNIQKLNEVHPFSDGNLSFLVNEIVLYKTHLNQEPKYEPIHSFLL